MSSGKLRRERSGSKEHRSHSDGERRTESKRQDKSDIAELDEDDYDEEWEHEWEDIDEIGKSTTNFHKSYGRNQSQKWRGKYQPHSQARFNKWDYRNRPGSESSENNRRTGRKANIPDEENLEMSPGVEMTNLKVKIQDGKRFAEPDEFEDSSKRRPNTKFSRGRGAYRGTGRDRWAQGDKLKRSQPDDLLDCREVLNMRKRHHPDPSENDLREKLLKKDSDRDLRDVLESRDLGNVDLRDLIVKPPDMSLMDEYSDDIVGDINLQEDINLRIRNDYYDKIHGNPSGRMVKELDLEDFEVVDEHLELEEQDLIDDMPPIRVQEHDVIPREDEGWKEQKWAKSRAPDGSFGQAEEWSSRNRSRTRNVSPDSRKIIPRNHSPRGDILRSPRERSRDHSLNRSRERRKSPSRNFREKGFEPSIRSRDPSWERERSLSSISSRGRVPNLRIERQRRGSFERDVRMIGEDSRRPFSPEHNGMPHQGRQPLLGTVRVPVTPPLETGINIGPERHHRRPRSRSPEPFRGRSGDRSRSRDRIFRRSEERRGNRRSISLEGGRLAFEDRNRDRNRSAGRERKRSPAEDRNWCPNRGINRDINQEGNRSLGRVRGRSVSLERNRNLDQEGIRKFDHERERKFELGRPGNFEPEMNRNFDDKRRNFSQALNRNFNQDVSRNFEPERSRNFDSERSRKIDQERSRNFDQDRNRNFDQDRSGNFDQDRSRNFDQDRSRNFNQDRSRNFDQDRSRNFGQDRSRNFDQDRNRTLDQEGRIFELERNKSMLTETSRSFEKEKNRDFDKERKRSPVRDVVRISRWGPETSNIREKSPGFDGGVRVRPWAGPRTPSVESYREPGWERARSPSPSRVRSPVRGRSRSRSRGRPGIVQRRDSRDRADDQARVRDQRDKGTSKPKDPERREKNQEHSRRRDHDALPSKPREPAGTSLRAVEKEQNSSTKQDRSRKREPEDVARVDRGKDRPRSPDRRNERDNNFKQSTHVLQEEFKQRFVREGDKSEKYVRREDFLPKQGRDTSNQDRKVVGGFKQEDCREWENIRDFQERRSAQTVGLPFLDESRRPKENNQSSNSSSRGQRSQPKPEIISQGSHSRSSAMANIVKEQSSSWQKQDSRQTIGHSEESGHRSSHWGSPSKRDKSSNHSESHKSSQFSSQSAGHQSSSNGKADGDFWRRNLPSFGDSVWIKPRSDLQTTPVKDSSSHRTSTSFSKNHQSPKEVIFVRGLARDVSEMDIRQDVSSCGLWAKDVRVVHSNDTGVSRGLAFVTFNSVDEAARWMDLRKCVLNLRPNNHAVMEFSNPISKDWECTRCLILNFKNRTACYQCNRLKEDCLDGWEETCPYPTNALLLRGLNPLTSTADIAKALKARMVSSARLDGVKMGVDAKGRPRSVCFVQLTSVTDSMALHKSLLTEPLILEHCQVSVAYCQLDKLPIMNNLGNQVLPNIPLGTPSMPPTLSLPMPLSANNIPVVPRTAPVVAAAPATAPAPAPTPISMSKPTPSPASTSNAASVPAARPLNVPTSTIRSMLEGNYTERDIPVLAQYCASAYAKNQQEQAAYVRYYTKHYKEKLLKMQSGSKQQ